MAGFGYGDDSLENDISQVKVEFKLDVEMSRALNKDARYHFDLLVFTKSKDYLCYVEAVHLMKHMKIKKSCPFVNDDEIFRQHIDTYDYNEYDWLSFSSRTNEFFVVVDNTEFFEA